MIEKNNLTPFVPDADQREVIDILGGKAVVFAAPGCGKTEILSQRIIKAHEDFGVPYKKMLCLTFTNRASREMRERIRLRINEPTSDLFVGNIHRLCIRFLIDNDLIPLDASIIDEMDQADILNELATEELEATFQHELKPRRISDICHKCVAKHQMEHAHPDAIMLYRMEQVADPTVEKYLAYKRENHILDFDDILLLAYDRLAERQGDEDYLYTGYSWAQVDEIQDLNPLQLAIVQQLLTPDATALFLGDEQQSIFSFIGGGTRTLASIRRLCNNRIHWLHSNHRSPQYILDLLNQYATTTLHADASLLPRASRQEASGKDALLAFCCPSPGHQNIAIARHVECLTREHPGESIGVLVRTNKMGQEVSEALQMQRIPHLLISNRDVFKRVDFKTLLSHFAVVADDTRSADWSRLLYQTKVFDKMLLARRFTRKLRQLALTPTDIMRYDGSSYVLEFSQMFHQEEFIVFDTETTGLDVYHDDIYQLAAVKVHGGEMVEQFEAFIHTDKAIPSELRGGTPNPAREAYLLCPNKLQPEEALCQFLSFVGNAPLVGHNVDYDRRILGQNMLRCGMDREFSRLRRYYDTLKVAKLLDPNLRSHRLELLLMVYQLQGVNSHNALDDVRATYHLMAHQVQQIDSQIRQPQLEFLANRHILDYQEKLRRNYSLLYEETHSLYSQAQPADAEHSLSGEIRRVAEVMQGRKYIRPIDRFDYILSLIDKVIIDPDRDRYFNQQVSNHLFELRTFNEADLFQNGIVREQVHVMTIHKAKGLQFDNVIVCDCTEGRFSFSRDTRQQEEDARMMYVALSRARKRIAVTYVQDWVWFLTPVIQHFNQTIIR